MPERGLEVVAAAALFDSDGVLVDSADSLRRTVAVWAAGHGIDAEHAFRRWHGRRAVDVIAELLPHIDADAEDARYEDLEVADAVTVTAIPGAVDLVGTPGLRWAIVTGCSRRLATARLGAAGIPLPDVVITGDVLDAGKPDPEGYVLAAERLGVRPEACVVIEDADAGVEAGLAAGCHVLAYGGLVTIEHPRVTLVRQLADLRLDTASGNSTVLVRSQDR
ncbi:MAG: HAD-IA family hydrolase [Microthrixaceae bacterium]